MIVLERSLPWKEHLHELEQEMGLGKKPIVYCLYKVSLASNPVISASQQAGAEMWLGKKLVVHRL